MISMICSTNLLNTAHLDHCWHRLRLFVQWGWPSEKYKKSTHPVSVPPTPKWYDNKPGWGKRPETNYGNFLDIFPNYRPLFWERYVQFFRFYWNIRVVFGWFVLPPFLGHKLIFWAAIVIFAGKELWENVKESRMGKRNKRSNNHNIILPTPLRHKHRKVLFPNKFTFPPSFQVTTTTWCNTFKHALF